MENFINQLFIESINAMAGNDWEWPDVWNQERKLNFLSEALKYGEIAVDLNPTDQRLKDNLIWYKKAFTTLLLP